MPHIAKKMIRNRFGAAAELARRANVSRTTVSRWLTNSVKSARIDRIALEFAADIREGRWPAEKNTEVSE